MRKQQCYAVKLAQAFAADIAVESGGVNSGITAAVSNVQSIFCGVSGGVQKAECDYPSSLPDTAPGGGRSQNHLNLTVTCNRMTPAAS